MNHHCCSRLAVFGYDFPGFLSRFALISSISVSFDFSFCRFSFPLLELSKKRIMVKRYVLPLTSLLSTVMSLDIVRCNVSWSIISFLFFLNF